MGKTRGRRFEKEGNVRWESKGSNYESSDELATASGVYDQGLPSTGHLDSYGWEEDQ